MQLTKEKHEFTSIAASLAAENKYITALFSLIDFPEKCVEGDQEKDDEEPKQKPNLHGTKTTRAATISELQERLRAIQGKRTQTFQDKQKKKGLKNQVKRKEKSDKRNAQKQQLRSLQIPATETVNTQVANGVNDNVEIRPKPIFNSDGKMVFSKFDFSGLGKAKKEKKQEKDPRKVLENLHKQKERLEKLEAEGQVTKVKDIKDKTAWRNAIAKVEGKKLHDDEVLLKKTMRKNENAKKASKKKWDKRIEGVKHAQDERQKKRQDNIDKRKKATKMKKLKKASKKGKIIPGF